MTDKKRLVSGIKSTGDLHVGNYFGAMRQFLDYQEEYDSFIFIADYHALTTAHDAERLRESIYKVAAGYIAIGLDPKKVTIYKQSDIVEHMELAWIFNSITTMPYLMRAHAFKDAEAKNKEISVGTFVYPMLMAADILLYDAEVVPVGKDQAQHIEIARDSAEKFNRIYADNTFKSPKALIRNEVAVVPGVDGQKMSKSYRNTIPLFGTDEEIDKAVMSIVTDSTKAGEPMNSETDTVFSLHKLFSEKDLGSLKSKYEEGSIGHKDSKEILSANIKELITPMRDTYNTLMEDKSTIEIILEEGGKKAKEIVQKKMEVVRRSVGVSFK